MTLPPGLLRALLIRGAIFWLGGRVAGIVVLGMAMSYVGRDSPLSIQDASVPFYWTIGLAALMCLADLHRRKETLLFANLGLRIPQVVFVATLPAVVLEAFLGVLL